MVRVTVYIRISSLEKLKEGKEVVASHNEHGAYKLAITVPLSAIETVDAIDGVFNIREQDKW